MSAHSSPDRLASVFANPAAALLLWGLLVTGRLNQDLLAFIGLRDVDIETIERVYAPQLRELRLLDYGGSLDARQLASLTLGSATSQITQAVLTHNPGGTEQAVRLLARLPLWLRDPELAELEREARLETARMRIDEVNHRRRELRRRETSVDDEIARPVTEHADVPAIQPASRTRDELEVKLAPAVHENPAVPGANSATQVKSDAPTDPKPAIPGAVSALPVKSALAPIDDDRLASSPLAAPASRWPRAAANCPRPPARRLQLAAGASVTERGL